MKMKLLLLFACFLVSTAVWAFGKININTADTTMLVEELTGIGPQKAERIVAYRKVHGPFKSVDDLVNVKGIGEALLNKNRDKLTVTAESGRTVANDHKAPDNRE